MRNLGFFPRLAAVNLVRNGRYYGPYLLSCGGVAAMYYSLRFMSGSEALAQVRGAEYLQMMSAIGCFIVAVFAMVVLLYANSFVMKRRQRELGIYNILGLEKRHIALVCLWETLFCGGIMLAIGAAGGILLSKLILELSVGLLHLPVGFPFSVSIPALWETASLFAVLLGITLAWNLVRVGRARPVELLRGGSAGEREPRTKRLLALTGAAALLGGYWMAVTVRDPVEALAEFFLAVGLVMLGTYCLFTAGSIAVLKRLRANRRFYYQTGHFTAVSGLLYRMKQNAVGLANICILSTMVLVTVSTTICLYVGLEHTLEEMFPFDIEAVQDLDRQPGDSMAYLERVRQDAGSAGTVRSLRWYVRNWTYGSFLGDTFSGRLDGTGVQVTLEAVTAEDYSRLTGREIILPQGEVLAWWKGMDLPETFSLAAAGDVPETTIRVREQLAEPIRCNSTVLVTSDEAELFLVVPDEAAANRVLASSDWSWRQFRMQMNLEGTDAEKQAAEEAVLAGSDGAYRVIGKQENAVDFYGMYGGFLFLGVFLGLLFLMVTVLIIYYKQISEGYEDQRRYEIMRQVGMTGREVRSSIHSQILLVFFLPLGTAGLHILAAFPMLRKMLELFQLRDGTLFALCTAGTLLVFCGIYAVVFAGTARTYDRIVGGPRKQISQG